MPSETLQLFCRGLEGKTRVIMIDKNAMISDLFKKIAEYTGMESDDIRLLYASKDLRETDEDGKAMSIEDYNIPNEGNLALVCRLRGGSKEEPVLKVYNGDMELTNEPDMFTLDDEEDGQRAKMPRGHAIAKDLRVIGPNGQAMSIEDYNIPNDGNLTLVCRLRGGSNEEPVLKVYDSDVELTADPDMITLDDEEDGQRAKMPCGHAISPESLTAFCRSLLTAGKYEFRCPYKHNAGDDMCGTHWEFYTVRKLAVLTEEERKGFEIKISENYLRKAAGMQECPKCRTYCERRCRKDIRVICPVCTKKNKSRYEFCWYCLKTWLGSGIKGCGNHSCTGEDPRLRILKTCPKKSVVEVPNCPAVRACPTCGLLIEHTSACKQMVCPCSQKFCFICLKTADAMGRYQCGIYSFKCEVSPLQTTMPGDD